MTERNTPIVPSVSAEASALANDVNEPASATGIETGNGDDLVYNTGTGSISTSKSVNGGSPVAGVAISTGGGRDLVVLEDGSVAIGGIDLGSGDDSLNFINSAKVTGLNNDAGSLDGGTGTDSVNFDGAGSYSGSIQNFEIATKQGNGIFTLSNLPTIQQLKISRGTLQTNSSYSFASGGSYEVWIYGGGDHGMLLANGGTATLAGNLSVIKGHGAYINGTKYNVVEGNIVDGTTFENVTLPAPSPLLNFSYVQEPRAAQIEANVASFTTMATNPVGMAVASYLDTILPSATGDLSDVIGQIQSLSAQDLPVAYASLSPDTYSSFTQSAALDISASNGILQQRMHAIRLGAASKDTGFAHLSGGEPVKVASNGSLEHLFDANDDLQSGYGLWLKGFGQKGKQNSDDTNAGYNYNLSGFTFGFDHKFTDHSLAGVSLGYANNNLNLEQNLGKGNVEADTLSVYASYFTENGYLEGSFAYGDNKYWNTRNILISGLNRVASSSHNGSLLAAMLGGGYYFNVRDWTWETFASLQHIKLDEDSFDETGAGSVSLHVDSRSTNSMSSDIGLRFRKVLERSNGNFIPELSIAWNHDYNIDDHIVSASFVGSPDTAFSVQGQHIAPNGLRLGTGVSYVQDNGLTSSLFYGAELRSGYTAQALLGQIRYEF